MKTILIGITLVLIWLAVCQSQTLSETDHNRYWYYRSKLVNDFMVPGIMQPFVCGQHSGYSIPAGGIGTKVFDNDENRWIYTKIGWGDGTSYLGYYISVLATEYRLLKNNGQSVENVKKELYYAMNAYERLDRNAESVMYPFNVDTQCPNGNLDGLFIRDDVGDDLFVENPGFDNKFSKGPVPIDNIRKYSSTGRESGILNADHLSYPSQDQVAYLFMGFALVAECLDTDESFNNYNFQFWAKSYTKTIIEWIEKNKWIGHLANDEKYKFCTSFGEGNQFGIARAAQHICGELHGNYIENIAMAVWSNKGDIATPFTPLSNGDGSVGSILMDAFYNSGDYITSFIQCYAAIGNSWTYGMEANCTTIQVPSVGCALGLPGLCYMTDAQACSYNLNLPQNILDNNPVLFSITKEPVNLTLNITSEALSLYGVKYGQEIYALLHNYLHGKSNDIGKERFAYILTSAPCDLPHYEPFFDPSDKLNESSEGTRGWWSSNKWVNPKKAYHLVTDEHQIDYGIFTGLDYMLLYNLYNLVYGQNIPYRDLAFKDFSEPIKSSQSIKSFSDITLSNQIYGDGLLIQAGNSIKLEPGARILPKSVVTINIAPITACNSSNLKRATVTDESSIIVEETSLMKNMNKNLSKEFDGLSAIDSLQKEQAYIPQEEYVNNISNQSNELLPVPGKEQLFFKLFPIPASDEMTLTYELFNDDEVKLTISELSGRIVQMLKWSDLKGIGKHSIDISQLSKGVYNCTIRTSKICETHKVIKTK